MAESQSELTLSLLHQLFQRALTDPRIRLLKSFTPPHMAAQDKWRLFFAARCHCGVSAMLYIDINKDKGPAEVKEKLPQLLGGLSAQTDQFLRMPCDAHQRMKLR